MSSDNARAAIDEETKSADAAVAYACFVELVYNDKEIDWDYWVQQAPTLSTSQAAKLMNALDPLLFKSLNERPTKNDPVTRIERVERMIVLADSHGLERQSPSKWLEWADAQNLSVHIGYRNAVSSHVAQRAAETLPSNQETDSSGSSHVAQPEPDRVPSNQETDSPGGKPLQRHVWQEEEILRIIRDLEHSPNALPENPPGKAGIKLQVRRSLKWPGRRFDKAWERLRSSGQIANKAPLEDPPPPNWGTVDTCGGG